jgi:homoserine dehydrogenase
MSTHQQLTIGLFGFGVVGEGIYKVLAKTQSLNATILRICIRNPEKKREAPADLFTTDRDQLLFDPQINTIIEVINDADAGFEIVSTALQNGKSVISASKKMIAEHLPELLALQQQTGMSFLYEAAAGASIPIIRNLEEYYDNDLLHSIKGIVNGSTNFILTKMFTEHLEFKEALLLAQQLGFAESDPALDIEGHDAAHKWTFLLTHAYGLVEKTRNLVYTGIQHINAQDAAVAREKNWAIKLVAQAQKLQSGQLAAFVLPQFVPADDPLAFVNAENNGFVIGSAFADRQFFFGKGAGSFPTASAIISDLSALRYGYHYEYKKLYHHTPQVLADDFYLRVYIGFESWKKDLREKMKTIEQIHDRPGYKYLVGLVRFRNLMEDDWWKRDGRSLICFPDPVIETLPANPNAAAKHPRTLDIYFSRD